MFRALFLSAPVLALSTPLAAEPPAQNAGWDGPQLAILHRWIAAAPEDALPPPDAAPLEAAERVGDATAIAAAAEALAVRLARMHLTGCCDAAARTGWHIADTDRTDDLPARVRAALAAGTLDAFFAGLAPRSPDYAALKTAYATETDPARRATLARNMDRWRWLPRDPGADGAGRYLLVNTAAFEVTYWHDGKEVGRWPVVNGKPSSPTPIFSARVTGVTFNPWWDIPPNIVREGIGALAARNPAAARAKGYVWSKGRFRQRPGPGNSLGLMKLAMPNRFNVYLHDTPSKSLFARPVRAFSHGCVRVSDALGFAATLLGKDRAAVDAIVATRATQTVPLEASIPVYIAYFTAGTGADGRVAIYPDVYRRDGRMGDAADRRKACPA